MKKVYVFLSLLFVNLITLYADGIRMLNIHTITNKIESVPISIIDSIYFSDDAKTIYLQSQRDGGFCFYWAPSYIQRVTFSVVEPSDTVKITWNGSNVSIINPHPDDIDIIPTDGHVLVREITRHSRSVVYNLSGTSDSGSFKIYAIRDFIIELNNLHLTNPAGPAINSQSQSISTTINLPWNTDSYLGDGENYNASTEDQKATLFSEGPLIIQGQGRLILDGRYKHGICSDDYVALYGGNINVQSATTDAVHANDSIMLDGSTLSTHSTEDGMDCAAAIYLHSGSFSCQTSGDAAKGISAGTDCVIEGTTILSIVQTGSWKEKGNSLSYCHGIKADSSLTIKGGTININSFADGGRGCSSDGDITISSGMVTITMAGNGGESPQTSNNSTFTTCCLKTSGNVFLEGGTIKLVAKGKLGTQGINTSSELVIGKSGTVGPTLDVTTNGDVVKFSIVNLNEENSGSPKAITSKGALTMYSGVVKVRTTGKNGEGVESKTSIDLKGGYLYTHSDQDDAINSTGPITFSGAFVYAYSGGNDAVDSDYKQEGAITVSDGVVIAQTSADDPEEALDCDDMAYMKLLGGRVFAIGGSSGESDPAVPSGTTPDLNEAVTFQTLSEVNQAYLSSSELHFEVVEGNYYAVTDYNDPTKVFFAFKAVETIPEEKNNFVLISDPDMKSNTTYRLRRATSAPTGASSTWEEFIYIGGELSETAKNVVTFTTSSK